MPKKRKTLKQKISVDQKRQTVQNTTVSTDSSHGVINKITQQKSIIQETTFSLPDNIKPVQNSIKTQKEQTVKAITTADYDYLSNDLLRTALLCVAIVIAEILIRLFYVH